MNDDLARRSHSVLMQAIALEERDRDSFVDSACASDPLLRARVADLLRALNRSGRFLETPALEGSRSSPRRPPLSQPASIKSYRVVRTLGAGGMATVYEAIQEQPQRRVALKVLRHGLVQTSALHRFQFETEVLARLRHPGIAQIFEAGAFDDGSGVPVPFFAMEYVPDARTITAYAREARLPLPERLVLLAAVCDAVQHGHQHGVIHRDLKPGNILVDAHGQPKVIDFGVARASDPEQAWITQDAGVGHLVGTLNYMSPEQSGSGVPVDVRADVYALGVILYDLVCGRLPHDLSQVSIPEALRLVRDATPPRPAAVDSRLRGDVDAIVMKAIDKDPERRYATAAALAADIRRHLAHEPILARPPTAAYRLRKFVRRHRVLVAAASAVVLSLSAGLILASRQAYLADLARQDAQAQQRAADAARAQEEHARRRAEDEAAIAREINTFWIDIIERGSPMQARRPDLPVRDALDRAAPRIATGIANPVVRKQLHLAFADAYHGLGLPQQDLAHAAAAWDLETQHPAEDAADSLRTRRVLARALCGNRRYDEAQSLIEEGLRLCAESPGAESESALSLNMALVQVLEFRGELARAAELMDGVLAAGAARYGEDNSFVLFGRATLARLRWRLGRPDDAERILAEVVERQRALLGPDHPETMNTMNTRALARRALRRFEEAAEDYRALLPVAESALGADHAFTLLAHENFALVLHDLGRIGECEVHHRIVYDARRAALGPDDPATLAAAYSLATPLTDQGCYEEAQTLLRHVVEVRAASLGEDHPDTLAAMQILGRALMDDSRYAEAEPLYRALLDQLRRTLPPRHLYFAPALRSYAVVLRESGRVEDSLPLFIESHDILLAAAGPRHPQMPTAAELVCGVLETLGRQDELAAWRERFDTYRAAQSRP